MIHSNYLFKNMKNLPPTLILSLSATGLAVARALAVHDVEIYGTDSQFSIGRFSRLIRKPFWGWYSQCDGLLLRNLIQFSSEQRLKPVLIPTDDKFMEFVSKYYHRLKKHFFLQGSLNPTTCRKFINKREFYKLCDLHQVAHPRTLFLTGNETADEILAGFQFPLILKPNIIHHWKKRLQGRKVILIEDKTALKRILNEYRNYLCEMILQEVITGPESNIFIHKGYFNRDGQVLCSFTGRKLRQYPVNFGSGCLVESAPAEEIAHMSVDFLSKLKMHGVCGSEFKYDPVEANFKIIEINIRPQLWDDLMRVANKELLWIAYRDLIGLDVPRDNNQVFGVKWSYLTRDLGSALWHIRKKNISLSGFLQSYKRIRTDAIIDPTDVLLLLRIPLYTFYQIYYYYFHKT
jgi:D-aspartate ligase